MKKYKNFIILGVIIVVLIIGVVVISGLDTQEEKPEIDVISGDEPTAFTKALNINSSSSTAIAIILIPP